jgi:hypothetical protein
MKPENLVELEKQIVKHYSEISNIKSEKLIDNMKLPEFWEKEKYRIKVQYNVACIGLYFVFSCVLIVFTIMFLKDNGFNTIKFSSITVLFSMIVVLNVFKNINHRKKMFKILEILKEQNV